MTHSFALSDLVLAGGQGSVASERGSPGSTGDEGLFASLLALASEADGTPTAAASSAGTTPAPGSAPSSGTAVASAQVLPSGLDVCADPASTSQVASGTPNVAVLPQNLPLPSAEPWTATNPSASVEDDRSAAPSKTADGPIVSSEPHVASEPAAARALPAVSNDDRTGGVHRPVPEVSVHVRDKAPDRVSARVARHAAASIPRADGSPMPTPVKEDAASSPKAPPPPIAESTPALPATPALRTAGSPATPMANPAAHPRARQSLSTLQTGQPSEGVPRQAPSAGLPTNVADFDSEEAPAPAVTESDAAEVEPAPNRPDPAGPPATAPAALPGVPVATLDAAASGPLPAASAENVRARPPPPPSVEGVAPRRDASVDSAARARRADVDEPAVTSASKDPGDKPSVAGSPNQTRPPPGAASEDRRASADANIPAQLSRSVPSPVDGRNDTTAPIAAAREVRQPSRAVAAPAAASGAPPTVAGAAASKPASSPVRAAAGTRPGAAGDGSAYGRPNQARAEDARSSADRAQDRSDAGATSTDGIVADAHPATATPVVASPAQVSVPRGDANPLTAVNQPSAVHTATAGLARAETIASIVSAANHAVLQRVATGSVDVPGLGRVAVRAAAVGGRVDIDVASDRAEVRAVLHASSSALASDLRQADVPVRQLRIGGADTPSAHTSAGGHGAPSNDTARRGHDAEDLPDTDDSVPEVGSPRPVRIVL